MMTSRKEEEVIPDFMRHSVIFHANLVEKPSFSVFSNVFPGAEVQVHLVQWQWSCGTILDS
jgi:hypothetical protein